MKRIRVNKLHGDTPSPKNEAALDNKILSIIQSGKDHQSVSSGYDLNQSDMVDSKLVDEIHQVVLSSNQSKVRSNI